MHIGQRYRCANLVIQANRCGLEFQVKTYGHGAVYISCYSGNSLH